MEFDAAAGMKANLGTAKAEDLRVSAHVLDCGTFDGQVGEVGDNLVVLTHLAGRTFFDALIRIDQIAALEVQTRSS
jgi:hypothetical protein